MPPMFVHFKGSMLMSWVCSLGGYVKKSTPDYIPFLVDYVTYYHVQCEAPKIAKLVYKSNNYGLWYLQLRIVTGAFVNQQTSLGGLTLYNYYM